MICSGSGSGCTVIQHLLLPLSFPVIPFLPSRCCRGARNSHCKCIAISNGAYDVHMTRRHGHGVIAIAIAQQGRQLAILSWRRRCRVVLAMGSGTIVCC